MIRFVADASLSLATLQGEPGGDEAIPILMDSAMSTVNLAEVQARLVREGMPPQIAWREANALVGEIVDFDSAQAELCGSLILKTKPQGLSAGDRACLALAIALGLPVYTADRQWAGLDVGIEVHLIR
jgi:ribonuclease VapC